MNNDPMYIGKKYGRLTVVGFEHRHRKWMWVCKCDCGNEKVICPQDVKNGKTRSCGCLHDQLAKERATKFRNSVYDNERLYMIYNHMKQRCYSPSRPRYKDYGGRGIKICDEWMNPADGFDRFVDWSKSNGYADDLTIDRIDNDGDYSPDNCRWQTYEQQNMNKRTTVYVTYHGEKWKLKDLCEEKGLKYDTIHGRIHDNGWSVEDAIDKPIIHGKNEFTLECEKRGLKPNTVWTRMRKYGWSLEKALNTPVNGKGNKDD